MRIYGIRNWIEQGYKQVKDELGWADFQVRSDLAIRRHQTLLACAFSFCWHTWFTDTPPPPTPHTEQTQAEADPGKRGGPAPGATRTAAVLAQGDPRRPRLADPRHRAHTLVESLVTSAPTR